MLDASGNPAVFQWDISPQPAALNSGVYPSPPAVAAAPSAAPPATNLAPSPYGSAPLPESHNGKANRSSQPPPLPHPDEGQFSDLGSDMSSLSHLWSAEADGQQTADADQPPASSSSAAAAAAGSTSREQLALQAARLVSDAQAHFAQAHQHEGVYAFAARPLTPNGSLQGGSQLGGSHLGGSHLGGSQLGGSQMGGSQLGLSDLLGSESDGPAAASPGMAPPHDPSLGGPRWALPPSVGSLRSFTGARGGMPTGPASTHMGAHGGLAGRGKHDMGAGGLGGAGYGQPHAPGMHGFGIDAGSLCALALGAPPLSLATAVAQALAIPAACSADRQPAGGGDRRPHATPAAVPFHDETESEHLAGIAASYGGFGGLLAQGGLGGGPAGARSGYGTPAAAIGFGERNEQRMTGQYTPRIASADAGIPQGGPSYQPCHAGSSALGLAAAVTRPSSGAPTAAPSALGKRAAAADTSDVWSTQAGDSKRARRKQGPRAAPFVQKLYKMASSPETDIAICWSHSGHSFWMRRPDLMEAVVLPQYFKHNRLTFFGKQLRAYGFKQRMAPSYLDMVREWYHTSGHFSRGGAAQLPLIQRGRPNIPPAPTPTGGTGQAPGAGGGAAASGATCKLEGGDSGGDASHGGSSDALSIPDSDSNAGDCHAPPPRSFARPWVFTHVWLPPLDIIQTRHPSRYHSHPAPSLSRTHSHPVGIPHWPSPGPPLVSFAPLHPLAPYSHALLLPPPFRLQLSGAPHGNILTNPSGPYYSHYPNPPAGSDPGVSHANASAGLAAKPHFSHT